MQLGSYSTFDCPTQKIDKAYEWLLSEFDKIGGEVRQVSNPHDFGPYPSFEIDHPDSVQEAINFVDFNDDDEEVSEEELDKQQAIADDWHDKANAIEAAYMKKFEKYL